MRISDWSSDVCSSDLLISGRRRGATVRAGADSIMVEVSRTAALKLMSSNPPAKRAITRISTERQLLQMFGAGLTPADLADILDTAEIRPVKDGEALLTVGDLGNDLTVIRSGQIGRTSRRQ